MRLTETAIEQESLQAAYSVLKLLLPVAIFGPATPLLYARYSFKDYIVDIWELRKVRLYNENIRIPQSQRQNSSGELGDVWQGRSQDL